MSCRIYSTVSCWLPFLESLSIKNKTNINWLIVNVCLYCPSSLNTNQPDKEFTSLSSALNPQGVAEVAMAVIVIGSNAQSKSCHAAFSLFALRTVHTLRKCSLLCIYNRILWVVCCSCPQQSALLQPSFQQLLWRSSETFRSSQVSQPQGDFPVCAPLFPLMARNERTRTGHHPCKSILGRKY